MGLGYALASAIGLVGGVAFAVGLLLLVTRSDDDDEDDVGIDLVVRRLR